MTEALKQIKVGQTLTARSIGAYDCVYTAEVLGRKGNFVTVKTQHGTSRVKVRVHDGGEFIYALGRYSMAPMFRAPSEPEPEQNNCDGSGPHTLGEVRVLPTGGDGNGNLRRVPAVLAWVTSRAEVLKLTNIIARVVVALRRPNVASNPKRFRNGTNYRSRKALILGGWTPTY